MSKPNKLIIPGDEVWVQQVYPIECDASRNDLNQFMLKAKTTKKDQIRNAQLVPCGNTLVIVYEKKVTDEDLKENPKI